MNGSGPSSYQACSGWPVRNTAGDAGRPLPPVGYSREHPAPLEIQECQSPNISTKFLPATLVPW